MNFLRSTAFNILAWRDGLRGWRSSRGDLRRLLIATPDDVKRQTRAKLSGIVDHAYRTVPHYRDIWTAIGFRPAGLINVEQLSDLPPLTKDTLRTQQARLISTAVQPAQLDRDWTSGTTHTRTEFYRDRACTISRVGRQWGILDSCGYSPGDRRGLVWGLRRDLPESSRRLNLRGRFRRFASSDEVFHCSVMSRQDMLDFIRRLRAFRPEVLYGYPSAIEQLGRLIQREGIAPIRVRRILCTAEPLHPSQRALLQEVFGAETFNLYCTREHGCIAFECHRHRGLHIDVGSVVVEILKDGRPAPPGVAGDVVITDLLNYGMPLVRNVIGDVAALSGEPCDCGSPLPTLSRFDGRTADLLYRPDGSIIVGHLLSYSFTDLRGVHRAQFVQEDVSSLDVYVVLDSGAPATVREEVRQRVGTIVGPGIHVRVHDVPDIQRHPQSGKFQEVVCRIARPAGIPVQTHQ